MKAFFSVTICLILLASSAFAAPAESRQIASGTGQIDNIIDFPAFGSPIRQVCPKNTCVRLPEQKYTDGGIYKHPDSVKLAKNGISSWLTADPYGKLVAISMTVHQSNTRLNNDQIASLINHIVTKADPAIVQTSKPDDKNTITLASDHFTGWISFRTGHAAKGPNRFVPPLWPSEKISSVEFYLASGKAMTESMKAGIRQHPEQALHVDFDRNIILGISSFADIRKMASCQEKERIKTCTMTRPDKTVTFRFGAFDLLEKATVSYNPAQYTKGKIEINKALAQNKALPSFKPLKMDYSPQTCLWTETFYVNSREIADYVQLGGVKIEDKASDHILTVEYFAPKAYLNYSALRRGLSEK